MACYAADCFAKTGGLQPDENDEQTPEARRTEKRQRRQMQVSLIFSAGKERDCSGERKSIAASRTKEVERMGGEGIDGWS